MENEDPYMCLNERGTRFHLSQLNPIHFNPYLLNINYNIYANIYLAPQVVSCLKVSHLKFCVNF